ncbi:MAG: YggT family protein [Anaerolineales bacterium]|nr:YggT family protein [Anaerolineales bacterium]
MTIVLIAKLISSLSNIIVLLVILQVLLSYFMSPAHPIRRTIDRLVEPMLAPIRRVVPLIGMFDFSPLILIILIQVASSVLINILLSLS